MNKQIYYDYVNYCKYAEQFPTYCNVYLGDVFQERLELPEMLFHESASPFMTEKGIEGYLSCNLNKFGQDLEPYRATFHEDLEIVHITEESDRLTNAEAFWENCGWRFGSLQEFTEDETIKKLIERATASEH